MNTVTCKHCRKELGRAETVSARPMQGWATIEESTDRFLCDYGSSVTQHVPVSRADG